MIEYSKLKQILEENNSFLITTHVNPDADAIGSQMSMYHILKRMNKTVHCINHSPLPYNLLFLDEGKIIQQFSPEVHKNLFDEVDVIICVDMNRADRTVSMGKFILDSKKIKIIIDHHLEPQAFADHYFTDTDSCATAHIIYDFIAVTNITTIDKEIAQLLYAGIMTDTGSFRFDRTTPEVHNIAAHLITAGVKPNEIFDQLYDRSLFSKVKLLGKALDSIKLYGELKNIAFMTITREMLKEVSAIESDTENFVNFTLSIENVVIGILFLQLEDGFKVSLRSKGTVPVNKIAGEFGGGGHLNASGLRLKNKSMSEFIPQFLNIAEEYLRKDKLL